MAFGKSWMKLSGHTMGEGFQPGPLYAMTTVAAVVQAIMMGWLVGQTGANSGSAGAIGGLYVGMGIVAAAMFTEILFAGRHRIPRGLISRRPSGTNARRPPTRRW